GERDGRFAFSPTESKNDKRADDPTASAADVARALTAPPKARRMQAPTSHLLMESMRQVDEARLRRNAIAPNGEALLFEEISAISRRPPPELPGPKAAIQRELLQTLQVPRSVDEILDEIAAPD